MVHVLPPFTCTESYLIIMHVHIQGYMYSAISWCMYYLLLHVQGYLIIMHVHVQCTYTGLHVQGYFMVHIHLHVQRVT